MSRAWKEANAKLKKKNRLLIQLEEQTISHKSFINSIEGGFFTYTKQNKEYFFSKGFEQILGYPSDTLKPPLWKQFIYEDDVPIMNDFVDTLKNGESKRVECRVKHPIEKIKWVLCIGKSISDATGEITNIYTQIIDISERKKLEEELRTLAFTDHLTDLSNRKALDRHLTKAIARSKRHNHQLAIMFIDLDDFKLVNDTLGHSAGDVLLMEAADRFHATIREEDYIARIGGDEFIIVIEETNRDEMNKITKRIIDKVSKPYFIEQTTASITLSIGISLYPDDSEEQDGLIAHADKAMYMAKEKGKNQYHFYSSVQDA
ncbi:MAG: sensor domain-containing diguanylate cyclase [Bacillus sp. (in: firmicutes)]